MDEPSLRDELEPEGRTEPESTVSCVERARRTRGPRRAHPARQPPGCQRRLGRVGRAQGALPPGGRTRQAALGRGSPHRVPPRPGGTRPLGSDDAGDSPGALCARPSPRGSGLDAHLGRAFTAPSSHTPSGNGGPRKGDARGRPDRRPRSHRVARGARPSLVAATVGALLRAWPSTSPTGWAHPRRSCQR